MTSRISLPQAVKSGLVVVPSAYKEEEQKSGSSSGWRRDHLKLLRVDFYAQTKLVLNRLLGVKESDWDPEFQARMSYCYLSNLGIVEGVRQLGAVDASALGSGDIEIESKKACSRICADV